MVQSLVWHGTQVTVKEVVSSEAEAIAEVERLNALRPEESCRYVWQATRHVAIADGEDARE